MNLRPPISRRGAAIAGGSAALVIGGVLFNDGLLLLLGCCGLLVLLLAWLAAWLNLRQLAVSLHLPKVIRAGSPVDLELTLENGRSFIDAFHTEIRLLLPGNGEFSATSGWTPAGSGARIKQSVTLPLRAYGVSHPIRLSSRFPLGLFDLSRDLELRYSVTILPRPIMPVELQSDGALYDSQPRGGLSSGQTLGEPRGIRPWQAGDSARRIHWPASVRSMERGHGLRIREYDPPGYHPDRCHLVFHSYASGGEMLREDRFERAISLLAGAVGLLQGQAIHCSITADFCDWQTMDCSTRAQLIECLSMLARVKRHQGTEAHDLEEVLSAVPSEHALMVLSDMAPDSWQHLLAAHPFAMMIDIRQVKYRNKPLHASAS